MWTTAVGKSQSLINQFKDKITKYVDITDMGDLHWILGIEVRQVHGEQKNLTLTKILH